MLIIVKLSWYRTVHVDVDSAFGNISKQANNQSSKPTFFEGQLN